MGVDCLIDLSKNELVPKLRQEEHMPKSDPIGIYSPPPPQKRISLFSNRISLVSMGAFDRVTTLFMYSLTIPFLGLLR